MRKYLFLHSQGLKKGYFTELEMRSMMIKKLICMALAGVCVLSALPSTAVAAETTAIANETTITQFMDCFRPMPIVEELSEDCWGAAEVGARDQGNGLEDRDLSDYCYWDGSIIRDEETGSYYMFASRWNQAGGHWGENGIAGWQGSQAIYAVSDNLYGPYEDQGPIHFIFFLHINTYLFNFFRNYFFCIFTFFC